MRVRTACPFCNAWIVEAATLPRVTCHRCGESFAAISWEETDEPRTPTAIRRDPLAFQKKLVIAIAAILALLVIAFVIYEVMQPKPPVKPIPNLELTPTIPPAALSGLQYLPSSANVILAVQPTADLAFVDPGESKGSPRAFFIGAGVPEPFIAALEQAGIPLENIAQFIVGLTLAPDKLIPGVTLVLKLSKPVANPEAFMKSLHAERKPMAGRPIYTTKLEGMLMSPIDDRTFLFGYTDDDLAVQNATGIVRFSPAVREALTQRLNPASYAWIATDNRNWGDANPFLRMEKYKKLAAKLSRGRSLVAGLDYDNGPRFRLQLDLADHATAMEVGELLKAESRVIRVDGTRVEMEVNLKAADVGKLVQSLYDALMK